ncbi:hypothetical protein LCGC14_2208710 [marine sediment metagenome]|uniref:Uncharacterized protein n=1 Tax=marine sediment metagenome TaxID=412755 RepID=A0A0F9E1Y1_9ZZZZ
MKFSINQFFQFRKKFRKGREKSLATVSKKMILRWCKSRGADFKLSELVWEFGLKQAEMPNIYVYLNRLVSEGEIKRVGSGHYELRAKQVKPVSVFKR